MIVKRLDSGYWYIAGVGACNYAQPPHWPCDEATLRAHMHPEACDAFVRDAMAYSDAASLRARIAAAVARCKEIERPSDDPYDEHERGMRRAAEQVRAVLEEQ